MAAKINGEAYAALDDAIQALDTGSVRDDYRNGQFARSDQTKDLDRRYRWDLFWAASGYRILDSHMDMGGLLDSHIDTALRAIVPPL